MSDTTTTTDSSPSAVQREVMPLLRDEYIGRKVMLLADHPCAGKTGTFIGWADTPFGERPKVRVDGMGGHQVCVKPHQWKAL